MLIILFLLSIFLPYLSSLNLEIFLDETITSKSLFLGYGDKVVFFVSQSKLQVHWTLNDDDDETGINSNVFPQTDVLVAEESFNLSCRLLPPASNVIILRVFVVGEKVLADSSNVWANRDEMITITDVSSCEKYFFNQVQSVISSSPFESVYYDSTSSSLRITQMSEKRLGKYICDSKLINIVGIKEVLEVKKTENIVNATIYLELQSLKVKYPKTEVSGGNWSISENGVIDSDSGRKLMGNDLMIERNSPATNLTIRLVSSTENWEFNVSVLSIYPSIKVNPQTRVIQNQSIVVTCTRPPKSLPLILGSKLKLTLFSKVLLTSSDSDLNHRVIPVCNSGVCLFKCIHQFYFAGQTYQFSNPTSFRYFQKVQLADGVHYNGVNGEAVALHVKEQNDANEYNFCDSQDRLFSLDDRIAEYTLIVLSRAAHNGRIYIVPKTSQCDIDEKLASFTFRIGPAVSVTSSEDGIVSFISPSCKQIDPVTLKIDSIPLNAITVEVDEQNKSVPLSGIVQLIPEVSQPTYSLLEYSLIVKPIGSGHQSLVEIHQHQVQVIPYFMLNWSTSAINLYHGEFVSICAWHMTDNEVCSMRARNSAILPSQSLRAKLIDNCLYLNVLEDLKNFNLACSTYSRDSKSFSYFQRFLVFAPSFTPFFTTFSNSTHVDPVCIPKLSSQSNQMQIIDTFVYPFRSKSLLRKNNSRPLLSKRLFIKTPPEDLVCRITFLPHAQTEPRTVYLKKTFFHIEFFHHLYLNQESWDIGCYNCIKENANITWTAETGNKTDTLTESWPIILINIEKFPHTSVFKCHCSNATYFEHVVHILKVRSIPVSISLQPSIQWIDIETTFSLICSVQFIEAACDSGKIALFEYERPECVRNDNCPRKEISFDFGHVDQIDLTLDLNIPISDSRKFRCTVTLDGGIFDVSQVLTSYNTPELDINDNMEVMHLVVGRTTNLVCSFTEHPPLARTYKIWWASPDGSEISSTHHLEELTLNLLVTENSAGKYACNARLQDRTSIVSRFVEIFVHHNEISPILSTKVRSPFTKIRTIEYMILICQVDNHIYADPGTLTITNGLPNCTVTGRCIKVNYSYGRYSLIHHISNPNESLDSSLVCVASTSNSNTTSVFNIQFAVKPHVQLEFLTSKFQEVGQEIKIECCVFMEEYPIPYSRLQWRFNISSEILVSHSSSQLCATTTISYLDLDHLGYYECSTEVNYGVIKNWTEIYPVGVRLRNEAYSIGPNTIVPLDSILKLVCSVQITDKSTILWAFNDVFIDQSVCKHEKDESNPTVSTLTCDVRLETLGPFTAACCTSSQINPKLISYQMSVVPKPSVESFKDTTDEASSFQSKTVLICNSIGYVTNMVISLILNETINEAASKRVEIIDDNYLRIQELKYTIPDQYLNNVTLTYRCDAIAKSSISMTQDYVSSSTLVFTTKASPTMNITVAISASLIGVTILCVAFWIFVRWRISVKNGINPAPDLAESLKTSS